MHILDKLITDVLHRVFAYMRGADGDEIVSRTSQNALVGLKDRITTAKAECAKATNEYESLKLEIVKAVQGQSTFPKEILSELVNNARTKLLDADASLSELTAELEASSQRGNAINADYDRVMEWAEIFDTSEMEVKKMIYR